jgi:hypothetical protein
VPNTLVHFAVQGAASRGLWQRLDPRWIYLGCLLPDVPWILRRLVVGFGLPVDAFDLRLYTMGLASLAGTLLLCAAVALLTAAPRLVLAVLGTGALLHLLLDATELKFGNGVHLVAPHAAAKRRSGLRAEPAPPQRLGGAPPGVPRLSPPLPRPDRGLRQLLGEDAA